MRMNGNQVLPPQNPGSGADIVRLFPWLHAASGDSKYEFGIQHSLSRGPGWTLHLLVSHRSTNAHSNPISASLVCGLAPYFLSWLMYKSVSLCFSVVSLTLGWWL